MFINHASKQVTAKIVYYGSGLSGKTTNLQYIFSVTNPKSRGELVSMETDIERTLFFDLLPLNVGSIKGYEVKFQLYTVPGQIFYNSTRKIVLKGVDGIVFVGDSQELMEQANVDSYNNLKENLEEQELDIKEIPMVIQFNKRDIKNVQPIDRMNSSINVLGVPYFEAIATEGKGVIETLKKISSMTLVKIKESIDSNFKESKIKEKIDFDTDKKSEIKKLEDIPLKKVSVDSVDSLESSLDIEIDSKEYKLEEDNPLETQKIERPDFESMAEPEPAPPEEDPAPPSEIQEEESVDAAEAEVQADDLTDASDDQDITDEGLNQTVRVNVEELRAKLEAHQDAEEEKLTENEDPLPDLDDAIEFEAETDIEEEAPEASNNQAEAPSEPQITDAVPEELPFEEEDADRFELEEINLGELEGSPVEANEDENAEADHEDGQTEELNKAEAIASSQPPEPVQDPEPETPKETPKKSKKKDLFSSKSLKILNDLDDKTRLTLIKKVKLEDLHNIVEIKNANSEVIKSFKLDISPETKKITIILDVKK